MKALKENIGAVLSSLFFLVIGITITYFYLGKSDQTTTIVGKTIYIELPGYVDNTPKSVPASKSKPISKDSSDFWKAKNDSLQEIIHGRDTTQSSEAVRSEYIYPHQITVRDSLTTNWVTIYPLNPLPMRAQIDSTRYDTLRISYTYMDTTIIVTRGNSLQTYAMVAGGAAIGSAAKDELGAAIGAVAALLVDWIFF